MAQNKNLHAAKENENDEFYTRLEDIEAEISQHKDYVKQFENKVVFCNCDDPEWSNFFLFFKLHFKQLKLKKLITTHYEKPEIKTELRPIMYKSGKNKGQQKLDKDGSPMFEEVEIERVEHPSYKMEWSGEMCGDDMVNLIKTPLKGNGDFRSEECVEILKEYNKDLIVVTNPPFSLFREYIDLLMKYKVDFVVLGRPDSCNYKNFFPYLKNNQIFIGYKPFGKDMYFIVTDEHAKELMRTKKERSGWVKINGKVYGRAQACWYTTLDLDKAHEPVILTKKYYGNESNYPQIDNYGAIFVDSIHTVPKDYFGVMGVPTNFLDEYSSDQFELLGITTGRDDFTAEGNPTKRYIKSVQHNPDGKTYNGSKVNTGMALALDSPPVGKTYYTAENSDKYLIIKYPRILIKRKTKEVKENEC